VTETTEPSRTGGNVLHEPVALAVLSLGFWAVAALAEASVLVLIADRR
jgi:hypothetical protein